MDSTRFLYSVYPRTVIKDLPGIAPIRNPRSLQLTKEDVKKCLKCGPVYRRFANEDRNERVTISNIDRLHNLKFMDEAQYEIFKKEQVDNQYGSVIGGTNTDPETTVDPETVTDPEATKDPETTATDPEVTETVTDPETAVDPEATEDPEVVTDPEVTETVTDPETTIDPEVTEDPEVVTDPETTVDPEVKVDTEKDVQSNTQYSAKNKKGKHK